MGLPEKFEERMKGHRLPGAQQTVGAVTFTRLLADPSGFVLLAVGTTVPADGGAGFAKGCLFIDTDVAAGTSGLYVNIGITTACNFNLVSNAAD
jgi:hypothetical protein